jgi:5-formyltetrahydrofolate cyclo-ligase
MPNHGTEKAALRLQAKEIRATLDMPALSATLCRRIAALPEYSSAQHVLLYLAMPGEVTVEDLMIQEGSDTKQFYVPRCAPKRRLAIHSYVTGETPLRSGPFGIREPDASQVPEATPEVLDLAIVPALLFSETRDRLGYGGGYYDRFLPKLSASCVRIGTLPEALVFPSLPCDPWDVPLDLIVTENRVLAPERCL